MYLRACLRRVEQPYHIPLGVRHHCQDVDGALVGTRSHDRGTAEPHQAFKRNLDFRRAEPDPYPSGWCTFRRGNAVEAKVAAAWQRQSQMITVVCFWRVKFEAFAVKLG